MSDARRWVYDFSEPPPAGCTDLKALLGGKGASLKEMSRAGLRVPPGFTIVTDACRLYLDGDRRWPEGLEDEVRAHLARLEEETGRRFGRGEAPLLVSVRSGAAVSMPGMMDTLLNCGITPDLADEAGDTPAFWDAYVQFIRMFARTVHEIGAEAFAEAGEPTARTADRRMAERHLALYQRLAGRPFPTEPWAVLVECIDAVFDSWENERAVAYRRRNDIRGLPGTAVNVQMMFPSEVSGIVFTQDPNNLPAEQMIIEASYGLGEAVVSGDVTPDRFVVPRGDFAAYTSEIGHKACMVSPFGGQAECDPDASSLDADQIAELGALSLKIEAHFGHPVDVEFGYADGGFALLQSRAIRGLEVARAVEQCREDERLRLKALADGTRRVWVTHNLDETLRSPTPLTWSVVGRFMRGDGGFGRLYQDLGYRPSPEVCEAGFLELIGGRIYADPDRQAALFWDGMPMTYDLEAILRDKNLLDRAPDKFDPEKADGRFLAKLPGNLLAMWRSSRRTKRARRDAKRRFEEEVLPPYLAWVRQERERDLAGLSDEALVALLEEREERVMQQFGPESLKPGFFGGLAYDALAGMLGQLMGPEEGEALASTLTRGLEGDTTFEQDALLWRVACGEATMEEFLDRFGHRAIGEMELARPRWREDPSYLEQMLGQLKAACERTPDAIHHENVERRREAEAALPAALEQWGGSSLREQIEADLADAQALLPYREAGKHYLMMGYELLRRVTEEMGRRWDLGALIYYLDRDELGELPAHRERLEAAARGRRVRWQAMARFDMADVIDSDHLDQLGLPPEIEAADELEGSAVAAGVATGTARLVFDPSKAGNLGPDYVLVCPSTDPGWTPLFVNARGLVVERGGVLSHGAIVARDFGIPAVVCPNATRLIPDGAEVRIDGNRGRISILSREAVHA